MSHYRESVERLHKAETDFRNKRNVWMSGKSRRKQKQKLSSKEPEEVTAARDKFKQSYQNLMTGYIYPLRDSFLSNSPNAVDRVIDYLSEDIPFFRSGYRKEWFLQKLKSVDLTSPQKVRLREIALDLCRNQNFQREFNRWIRSMIKVADEDFVHTLKEIEKTSERNAQVKTKWMLEKILRHRPDLN